VTVCTVPVVEAAIVMVWCVLGYKKIIKGTRYMY